MGMIQLQLGRFAALIFLFSLAFPNAQAAQPSTPLKVDIDLQKPFDTRSPWHFLASQEPSVLETLILGPGASIPKDNAGIEVPGLIHFCLKASPIAPCDSVLPNQIPPEGWYPHYLNRAEVVFPSSRASPLFLLQAASEPSGDSDQAVFTQLLAYDPANDGFKQIYAHVTYRNNNQEDRFIVSGPLQGSVVSVEPTPNAPFAYWVTVHMLEPVSTYKQVLHYRSATRYADGNPLPVIDSEMPNIERRLGLWHPGMPLPIPTHPCPNPRLSHAELWCE
jgi:hypothetical protein